MDLHDHYVRSSKRLLLLDYDGTLVGFANQPEDVKPTAALKRVLTDLDRDPRNTVVVVSGRDRAFLDSEFEGLGLKLAAEHGFFVKSDGRTWQTEGGPTPDLNVVAPLLQEVSAHIPGSFVERKDASLVWHYRSASSRAETAAGELESRLAPLLLPLGLVAVPGHEILEVRPADVHKGQVGDYWLGLARWDFMMAAGDDATDEDLFAVMPPGSHTIKVGPGPTRAIHRLADHRALSDLLSTLAIDKI